MIGGDAAFPAMGVIMAKYHRSVLVSLALLTLVACGGGGGGGGSSSPNPVTSTASFPAAQAIANFFSTSHTYNVNGTGKFSGIDVSGTGTVSFSSAVGATFEGQSAFKVTLTVAITLSGGGQTVPVAFSVENYFTTNYDPLGFNDPGGGSYCVIQGNPSYPSSVKVGDTATLYTQNCYQDSTKNTPTENDIDSFLVEADTATSAIFNLIENTYTGGTLTDNSQERYRIDENGNFDFVSVTGVDYTGGDTLILTAH